MAHCNDTSSKTVSKSSLRQRSCSALKCICHFEEQRNYRTEFGSWEIVLCDTCGIYGTHRLCSSIQCFQDWRCKTCNIIADNMNYEDIARMIGELVLYVSRNMAIHHMDTSSNTVSALEMPSCNLEECICPYKEKEKYQENIGSWEIVLCHTCGIYGTHRLCSFVQCFQDWRCETCNIISDYMNFKDISRMIGEILLYFNMELHINPMDTSSNTVRALEMEMPSCNLEKCICPYKEKEKYQEKIGSWEIVLCDTCGIYGTHRLCSFLKCFQAWYCKACQS